MPSRNYDTLSFKSMALPPTEIREHVTTSNPWPVFLQLNENICRVYYLCANHILSHYEGIKLEDLERVLEHEYFIPSHIVNDFIHFIIVTETKGIEFESLYQVRKPVVWKKPRQAVSSFGPCSKFTPKPK